MMLKVECLLEVDGGFEKLMTRLTTALYSDMRHKDMAYCWTCLE